MLGFAAAVGVAAAILTGCSTAKQPAATSATEPQVVTQLTFATPEDAVQALAYGTANDDRAYLRQVFGPEVDQLSSGDPVVDAVDVRRFAQAIEKHHEVVQNADGTATVLIGEQSVEFPVPLEKVDGRWMFNTPAGVENLTDLRVGYNELRTIEFMGLLPAAQEEYRKSDPDGDGIPNYAQRLASTPGKKDGLYWEAGPGEPQSPLGPVAARGDNSLSESLGFNGYFFRVLVRQGSGAPSGAKEYMKDGSLTEGFAVVAWPAVYDGTGVMTFLVGVDGIVYEKDAGKDSAQTIQAYDPSDGWRVSGTTK
ncbi:MAG: DUF2950 family protein [Phycisphaeraceae bacterium]|nr:DUF2950 family protein [Phycisphaeraceae bacterium]